MDPNKCLEDIRKLITNAGTSENQREYFDCLDEVATLFQTLDVWLTQGGFKPDDWNA